MQKWKVTFNLPSDFVEIKNEKFKVKDSCTVEVDMDFESLLLILQNDVNFFCLELEEKDKSTFDDKDFDTGIYSRYKVKNKTLDLDEKTAEIDIMYNYY